MSKMIFIQKMEELYYELDEDEIAYLEEKTNNITFFR